MTQLETGKRNAQVIALYREGKTIRECAKVFDISFQYVDQILEKYNEPRRVSHRPKTYIKLTLDHATIQKMRNEGKKVTVIAKALGLYPRHEQYSEFLSVVSKFPLYGNENFKECFVCGFIGDRSLFYDQDERHKRCKCKKCHSEYQKQYRAREIPEKRAHRLEKMRIWGQKRNLDREAK